MNKKSLWLTFIMLAIFILGSCALAAGQDERPVGQYMTLVDENNQIILQTGSQVYKGDEYISADNSRYKVVEVVGRTARCVYKGKETMPEVGYNAQKSAWYFKDTAIPAVSGKKATVAIYHTHSDESYVPNDGKESINGNGGIYDVGQSLSNRLKQLGFNVIYNKNNHNPHDINAYNRSRRTAAALLKQRPDAIIDVHRDAVPAGQYQANVNGKEVTKVKLVVGKQNPNMKTNLEFAKRMKSIMDKKEPGLSNGIYIGKGDYNQDLSPHAMLIEVGAHTNNKVEAEKGVRLFADTLPMVMGVSTSNAKSDYNKINTSQNQAAAKPLAQENSSAWTTILLILVIAAAVVGGFYLLNRRNTERP